MAEFERPDQDPSYPPEQFGAAYDAATQGESKVTLQPGDSESAVRDAFQYAHNRGLAPIGEPDITPAPTKKAAAPRPSQEKITRSRNALRVGAAALIVATGMGIGGAFYLLPNPNGGQVLTLIDNHNQRCENVKNANNYGDLFRTSYSSDDEILTVTRDTDAIQVGHTGTVVVPKDISIGKIEVCGGGTGLKVAGKVNQALVFGGAATFEIEKGGEVRYLQIAGGGCQILPQSGTEVRTSGGYPASRLPRNPENPDAIPGGSHCNYEEQLPRMGRH